MSLLYKFLSTTFPDLRGIVAQADGWKEWSTLFVSKVQIVSNNVQSKLLQIHLELQHILVEETLDH